METETITEYRELTDDADFGNFAQLGAQRELAKGKILGDLAAKEGQKKVKEESSSGELIKHFF